jgi:hypothetical protein
VFGGNFHTHNALHIPPGVDVVCFSNGADYARGMRYAVRQAKAGESADRARTCDMCGSAERGRAPCDDVTHALRANDPFACSPLAAPQRSAWPCLAWRRHCTLC